MVTNSSSKAPGRRASSLQARPTSDGSFGSVKADRSVCSGSFTSVLVCPPFGHCGHEFLRHGRDGPITSFRGRDVDFPLYPRFRKFFGVIPPVARSVACDRNGRGWRTERFLVASSIVRRLAVAVILGDSYMRNRILLVSTTLVAMATCGLLNPWVREAQAQSSS